MFIGIFFYFIHFLYGLKGKGWKTHVHVVCDTSHDLAVQFCLIELAIQTYIHLFNVLQILKESHYSVTQNQSIFVTWCELFANGGTLRFWKQLNFTLVKYIGKFGINIFAVIVITFHVRKKLDRYAVKMSVKFDITIPIKYFVLVSSPWKWDIVELVPLFSYVSSHQVSSVTVKLDTVKQWTAVTGMSGNKLLVSIDMPILDSFMVSTSMNQEIAVQSCMACSNMILVVNRYFKTEFINSELINKFELRTLPERSQVHWKVIFVFFMYHSH